MCATVFISAYWEGEVSGLRLRHLYPFGETR